MAPPDAASPSSEIEDESLAETASQPNVPAAPSYVVVAIPVAGQSQTKDTQCLNFAVDSIGQQYATGSQGAAYCWSN